MTAATLLRRTTQSVPVVYGPPAPVTPPAVDLTGLATYYVDSVAGSNGNSGLTTALPKLTLAGVPVLVAGNTVALKCGSEFREALPFGVSGTVGSPITIGQYGTGVIPKIKGSKDYGTALTWTVYAGSVYTATAAAIPAANNILYVDEITGLRKMGSIAAVVAPGQYFPDIAGSKLYVWMWDSTDPTGHRIEANGNLASVATMGARAYRTVQDIGIYHGHGALSGIQSVGTQPGSIIQRCHVRGHFGVGIWVGSPGMIAKNNWVTDCWDAVPYPASNGNSSGFTIGNGVNGTGAQVFGNRLERCYYSIRLNGGLPDAKVHHNLVIMPQVNGIDNQGATGTAGSIEVYNNTIHHRPNTAAGHGIDQQVGDGLKSRNNIVYCDFTGTATNVEMLTLATGTGANTSEDYTLAYRTPASTAYFGTAVSTKYMDKASYVAAVVVAYGAGNDTVLLVDDPLFVDAPNGDYRLRVGSPARDAGMVIAGITDGYTGAAPDIGCYEMP